MKILVTGAAGFVGGHLIDALKMHSDDEIYGFVLNKQEWDKVNLPADKKFEVDITDKEVVFEKIELIKPDRVFHLAAQSSVALSWKAPSLTYSINITGTVNLLEALSLCNKECRVLLIGSAEQYGSTTVEEQPIDEKHPLSGNNPYSVSKMTQEAAAMLFLKNTKLQIICVRAFNHIGAGQETKFVIPDWCSQVIEMENNPDKEQCLMVGNIKVRRDFTDVRDIVKAYILLADKGISGEVYNVGSGISHSLEEVLNIIKDNSLRSGIRWKIDENKLRPTDIDELRANVSKLKQATGWQPVYSLEQSVKWIMEEMRRTWKV